MTLGIIITLCTLILLAYIFDVSAKKTKIPSVILLLILGYAVKIASFYLGIKIPNLQTALPILGTIGLILIVLEGSLELEFNASKIKVLKRSFVVAILPLLVLSLAMAFAIRYFGNYSLKDALVNAIPLFIISSAIAIPSAKNISIPKKEFVIYESSLSDILGVILFNFFVANAVIGFSAVFKFFGEFLLMVVISFLASVGLAFLLSKIKHNIKFAPIILLIIIIYAISKIYHLPALIFILVFGLFIGNLDELKRFRFIDKLKPEILNREVGTFKEIVAEATFLVRALFFILFGFLIELNELLDTQTLIWSAGVCAAIFAMRFLQLKLFGMNLQPLVFFAPRGLITILLYLTIPIEQSVSFVNKPMIIQVIILTSLVMMFGLLIDRNKNPTAPVFKLITKKLKHQSKAD